MQVLHLKQIFYQFQFWQLFAVAFQEIRLISLELTLFANVVLLQLSLEKAKVILYLTRNLGINIAGVKIILNLIELQKINIDQQYKFIERFAIENGFSELQQEKNIEKHLRKGRKSKPLG